MTLEEKYDKLQKKVSSQTEITGEKGSTPAVSHVCACYSLRRSSDLCSECRQHIELSRSLFPMMKSAKTKYVMRYKRPVIVALT